MQSKFIFVMAGLIAFFALFFSSLASDRNYVDRDLIGKRGYELNLNKGRGVPLYNSNVSTSILAQQEIMQAIIDDFKVNDDGGTIDKVSPAIAGDGSGNFVVTWNYSPDVFSDIYAQRYNSSGIPLGDKFKVNDDVLAHTQADPSVAMNSSGDFVIAWGDNRNGELEIYAQRYSSSGVKQGSNFNVHEDIGNEQSRPVVGMDGDGNFVIVYEFYIGMVHRDIYARKYNSDGTPSGSPFKVNDDIDVQHHFVPAIDMNSSGMFVITWQDERNGNWDVYTQRYDSFGNPSGSNYEVNEDAGTAGQFAPAIALDGSGNYVITWVDYRNGLGDIYAQRYDSFGNPSGANFKVNDDVGTALQQSPVIVSDGSGNFVITWEDERTPASHFKADIYAQRYDFFGNPSGSNFKVNDDVGSQQNQSHPAADMNSSGEFVIVWHDKRNCNWDIYAQRYNSSGTPQGNNFIATNEPSQSTQYISAISFDALGNFVIAWEDQRYCDSLNVYAQRFDFNGNPKGSNFKVTEIGDAEHFLVPDIVVDCSGNFIITWQDNRNGNGDIYAQRYSSSGEAQGVNFKVNDDPTTWSQGSPSIAGDASGNFIIAFQDWRNGLNIYAQRYDSDGNPQGVNFKVNDTNPNSVVGASVAMNGSGNFVITWFDDRNGHHDVWAQRYNYLSEPQGSNFKVNDDVGSHAQYYPSVAINSSGDFVISWMDERNGNWDIYAQRYRSNGNLQGNNFKVNCDEGFSEQDFPKIGMDGSGNFIITWEDRRNGLNVYARRYKSNGQAVGSDYLVPNPLYTLSQSYPDVATNGSYIYFSYMGLNIGSFDIVSKVVDWSWRSDNPNVNTYTGYSPIDLVIIDPLGDSIGIGFNSMTDATYDTTTDANGDGDKDDIITIFSPLVGDYLVRVIAEPGADTGHYSLGVKLGDNGESMLVEDAEVPAPGEADSVTYEVAAYLRGDSNRDGEKSISDVIFIVNYLFKGGEAPEPLFLADVNCDGNESVSDVVYLINYLFKGGPVPCS